MAGTGVFVATGTGVFVAAGTGVLVGRVSAVGVMPWPEGVLGGAVRVGDAFEGTVVGRVGEFDGVGVLVTTRSVGSWSAASTCWASDKGTADNTVSVTRHSPPQTATRRATVRTVTGSSRANSVGYPMVL
jgi:hypothetical protein